MSKILLVDGQNLLMRSYFAAKSKMSNNGVVTGGLVIFVNYLSKYIKDLDPDKTMICWDLGGSDYRRKLFPAYKASRTYSDTDVHIWDLANEFLDVVHIPHLAMQGVEADDLIAYYVRTSDRKDQITICSGDKDFLQLLSPRVDILIPGDDERWTPFRFRAVHKCKPNQWGLVLAMAGDTADNVPGIPGIGVKTAVKLLTKYDGSLEQILKNEKKFAFQGETVERNFKLIDLINPGPELKLAPIPMFNPVKAEKSGDLDQIIEFCNQHAMIRLKQRIIAGDLW
jgi:5'-3' exonuclease